MDKLKEAIENNEGRHILSEALNMILSGLLPVLTTATEPKPIIETTTAEFLPDSLRTRFFTNSCQLSEHWAPVIPIISMDS